MAPTFDVDAAVEEARHAVRPVPDGSAALELLDPSYRATFDSAGVTYTADGSAASLGIELDLVKRGGQVVTVDVGSWDAESNVAARALGRGLRERVTGRRGEIEWDVVLTAPLSGTGDLVVEARLTGTVGEPRRVEDGAAWQLELTDGTMLRLGETVILDATGAEVDRSLPRITDGRIELVAPERVLRGATYPLTIDPTVGSSTPVAQTTNGGPTMLELNIAFDGQDFLVVWADDPGATTEVYGAQVSGDGSQVHLLGAISDSADGLSDLAPDVAWNGTRYLVVWQQSFNASDQDVLGRRLNKAGFLLGPVITIARPDTNQVAPAVSAASSTFYAVWSDDRNGNFDIVGARVSTDGAELDGTTDGKVVTTDGSGESEPDLAWSGTNFLVAYQRAAASADVYALRVNSTGNPVGVPVILSSLGSQQERPAVASNGSNWLVVWQDNRSGLYDIFGSRVSAAGARLDANGIPVSVAPDNQRFPQVAFNGTFLVAWFDPRDNGVDGVYASRVASDGTVQDPAGFLIDSFGLLPAVAPAPGSQRWAIDLGEASSFSDPVDIRQRIVASK